MGKKSNDDKQDCSGPPYRLPDLARVPRPGPADPAWAKAPIIAGNAGVRTDARLRDLGEKIRKRGDPSEPELRHAGFGTTSRGLGPCNHYLPANRFAWWDADVPETDAIKIRQGAQTVDDALRDEFCSPFSTIVGANLSALPNARFGRVISWENLPDGTSPNAIPGIEFSVRTARPESVPVIQTLRVNPGGAAADLKILINGVEDDHQLHPTRPRPSLFIDFALPQRAVGLQFGFLGEPRDTIDPGRVQLIAYDRDGTLLIGSSAREVPQVELRANTVFNLVGVRHQGGAISSVELRFHDPENQILEPQIVFRIWHEPLPSSAVKQGTLATEGGRGAFAPPSDRPVIRLPPPPVPFGPDEIRLPFRCNRAVVMLRGFKLQFLDQHP